MTRVAIYARQSLDRDGNELGVDRQLTECRKLAQKRSYDVIREVVDNNKSASSGSRPGYEELLKLIERKQVDVVVVLRVDRLLRRLTDLESLIELSERTGVQIATVEGDIDLGSSSGRLIARILASVARGEVETKSARQKLANAQKAAQGLPHGGKRPYGYEDDLITVREDEAAVLREMARMLMSGYGFKEIAWRVNEQGHLTTLGRPWYAVNIRAALKNPRYAGVRHYQGNDYPAVWKPIFDSETWEALQLTIRSRHANTQERPIARKYLLTGFVYCGKCGLPLNGTTKSERGRPKRRIYNCRAVGEAYRQRGCGGVMRAADPLEDWVKECVIARLDSPRLAALLAGTRDTAELRELLADRELKQIRLNGLVDDYATGLLDRAQFARAKVAVESELVALQKRITALSSQQRLGVLPVDQTVREAWVNADGDSWRRSLMELLIKRVVVNDGSQRKPLYKGWRFDPEAVAIEWLA